MSNKSDNQWRQSNSHNNSRNRDKNSGNQQNHQQSNQQSTQQNKNQGEQRPRQEAAPRNPASTPTPNNAWTNNDRVKAATTAKGAQAQSKSNTVGSTGGQDIVVDKHVPVKEFNTAQVKEFMKKNYTDALAGDAKNEAQWKADGDAPSAKSGNPWASKPNVMANNQDFWVQLTKQINAREHGGGG